MKLTLNRVITCFSLLLTVIFVTAACTLQAPRVNSSGQPEREYTYQIPDKVTDGWKVSSLEEESIDTVRINELMSNILLGNFPKIHSVLLVKNGKLVLEEYFYDYNRERLHQIRSTTKSIGSVLTGIAIDQGIIYRFSKKKIKYMAKHLYSINLNYILIQKIDFQEFHQKLVIS